MTEKEKEISEATQDVLAGRQDADCAKAMLHIRHCEKCRRDIIENGEPLNR